MPEKIKKLDIAIYRSIIDCMDMIKKAIEAELKRRQWTCYRLSKELKGKLPQRTIYGYLSGESDISSERASIILKELGLKIKR
jgi:hypothetical protein